MTIDAPIGHPSINRHHVRPWQWSLALLGAPVAWVVQMISSQILVGQACRDSVAMPERLSGWLAVLHGSCVLVAIAATLVTWLLWKRTRPEQDKGRKHVIDIGEGRTRFIVMLGLMGSMIFVVATFFTAGALLLVETCR